MSVGVMKDYKLKQRNLRSSHTLGKRLATKFTTENRKSKKDREEISLVKEGATGEAGRLTCVVRAHGS